MYRLGADSDECCDETPVDGVFDFELGFEERSVSAIGGGWGDRDGRDVLDIDEGDREAGKLESEVRRLGQGPLGGGGYWVCVFE